MNNWSINFERDEPLDNEETRLRNRPGLKTESSCGGDLTFIYKDGTEKTIKTLTTNPFQSQMLNDINLHNSIREQNAKRNEVESITGEKLPRIFELEAGLERGYKS